VEGSRREQTRNGRGQIVAAIDESAKGSRKRVVRGISLSLSLYIYLSIYIESQGSRRPPLFD